MLIHESCMTPEERDRLTRNEVRIDVVCADVAEIKLTIGEANTRLRSIEQTLSEAQGGWRTIMLLGGVGATLGAALTHMFTTLFHR
ncbi:MAG TPA: hypothetical protein VL574_02640 [Stellaceae bacterium]|jgi:hypothetical protein|nr:hypothetical protein [Stellaceae bacterium]